MARRRKTRRRDPHRDPARVLTEYHESGLSRRAFCESTGVPLSTLGYWLRKAGKTRTEPTSLIPVRVMAAVEANSMPLEVLLANERVVRVRGDFDAELLAKLICVVEAAC
jgi:hypothetical protein